MGKHECWHCGRSFATGDELVDHLSDEGVLTDVTRGVIPHAGR